MEKKEKKITEKNIKDSTSKKKYKILNPVEDKSKSQEKSMHTYCMRYD